MKQELLTDEQVEVEITRLLASEDVILAKKEARIRLRRRQYMYNLRTLEKRGKQLREDGITMENMEHRLFSDMDPEEF
jgi:repressor of nif and glnA expression